MKRVAWFVLFALPLAAATPLFRASFEIPSKSWSVLRGVAAPDATVTHDDKKALRLEPGTRQTCAWSLRRSNSRSANATS